MSVVINNKPFEIPNATTKSWLDNPIWRLKAGEDRYNRPAPSAVTAIVFHTTAGDPGPIIPGTGPFVDPWNETLGFWTNGDNRRGPGTHSGSHMWIGPDGTIFCFADLLLEATPHAGNNSVNARSIGIEIYQSRPDKRIYQVQLDSALALADWLTATFGIQRQLHWPYKDKPAIRIGPRGFDKADFYGIFGHREAADNRGRWDPGDAVFQKLMAAGYEGFDTDKNEDKTAWAARQAELGVTADGVPGPHTRDALAAKGKPDGMWVARPIGPSLAALAALAAGAYLILKA